MRNWVRAILRSSSSFRTVVLQDQFGRRQSLSPVSGESAHRAAKAVEWLLRAQDATIDGGVSYGYFPLAVGDHWQPSYPETTGYIMSSLLAYAQRADQPNLVDRVARMAYWEAAIQMPTGAVQAGKVTRPVNQRPAAFNTGMVLDGFVSLLKCRSDAVIAEAADRAAAFLVADLTDEGCFQTNGLVASSASVTLFNVLCAWALYRYSLLSGEPAPRATALRAAEAALHFQADNGWFAENCLTDKSNPLTHTIGYTLQGLLEVAALAGREDILRAVERGFAPIVAAISRNGYLAGRFSAEWRPTASYSCLTGSAQLAIVGYRLAAIGLNDHYGSAADRLVNFLKALQRINTGDPNIDGALAGSYPIFGDYMSGGYPNWATKYLLDALMLQTERAGLGLAKVSAGREVPA